MRRELKYLIAERDRARLAEALRPYVQADAHASGETPTYTVRSIYFDTPAFLDYADKLSGDLSRRKVRVRGYDTPGSGPLFLEVKRKEGGAVWKDRARVSAPEAARYLAGDHPMDPPDALARFLYRLRAEHRRPTLLVTYDRQPYVGRFDPSLRITFDRRLRGAPYPRLGLEVAGLYSDRLAPVLEGHFILEVKYDRVFPSWMRETLARFGAERQALSKYAMGLEAQIHDAPWRFGRPARAALS